MGENLLESVKRLCSLVSSGFGLTSILRTHPPTFDQGIVTSMSTLLANGNTNALNRIAHKRGFDIGSDMRC